MITELALQKKCIAVERKSADYVKMAWFSIWVKRPEMPETSQRIVDSAMAGAGQAGMRLDQAAAELFPDYSRGRLQKWIRSGELTMDGRTAKPTYKVLGGESLVLEAELQREEHVIAQDIPLELLYQDEDLLVVDKPAGLVVHPAAGNPDGTLQNALLHFDAAMATLPRAGIVHRLDKETSGVMVVARSLRAHHSLVEQLQARQMSRIYRAVALGDLQQGGTVDAPIGRHPVNRKRMAGVASGRHAVSHYRVLQNFVVATYVEVSLETGRTHQIRVHLKHIGHALAGDPVYARPPRRQTGSDPSRVEALRKFPRQALHAHVLKLEHPGSGRQMSFKAPLPDDLNDLLDSLAGDDNESP